MTLVDIAIDIINTASIVFIALVALKAYFIGGCFDGEEKLSAYLPLRLKDFFSIDYKPPIGTDLRTERGAEETLSETRGKRV